MNIKFKIKEYIQKLLEAINQEGEYQKNKKKINKTRKDFERERIVLYFYSIIILLILNEVYFLSTNQFTYFFLNLLTGIGTTFICANLFHLYATFFLYDIEEMTYIHDYFENRKEKIHKCKKERDGIEYIIQTDKNEYILEIEKGEVILTER